MEQIIKTIEFSTGLSILELSYLLASVLFILGLKRLSHPETARSGNLWAAFGMGFAILTTILFHKVKQSDGTYEGIHNIGWILGALLIGSVVGWLAAKKVKMTAMPQMVSLFNGMGGACAALISLMEFPHIDPQLVASQGMLNGHSLAIMLGLMIGSVSFSGSMIAFGKLDEKIGDIRALWMRYVNISFIILLLAMFVFIMMQSAMPSMGVIYLFLALSLLYGITLVMPIGGADMPVVISLLNSFTGVAAAMGGFLYGNQAMLTGGILVGSSGTILTILMCKAMNRSLLNVIVGAFGGGGAAAGADGGDKTVKEISLSDAAILLTYSQKVFIVPGYGLAVAQAQHTCHELDNLLSAKGVEVKYAIHPVAGRMPGHMNVLLAEADVPYEKLIEAEDANNEMSNTDVIIVVGANDVVNPAAEDDPGSPIYGMPVIKAWEARNVIIMKRSMGKGYAAIENMLFYHQRSRMLFGDAKASMQKLIGEIKSL
ncbi:MAG: NAD(P)(+) transhydrogenase (Re/Si-specific) subunit beta [Bacteroidota bacterium]